MVAFEQYSIFTSPCQASKLNLKSWKVLRSGLELFFYLIVFDKQSLSKPLRIHLTGVFKHDTGVLRALK